MKHLSAVLTVTCVLLVAIDHHAQQILPDLYGENAKGSIGFWENKGQVVDQQQQPVPGIVYYSQGAYPLAYLQKDSKFSIVLKELTAPVSDSLISHRLDVRPYNANSVNPVGSTVKAHYQNFYLPWTVPGGAEYVNGYDRVVYEEIYKDIDMHFYSGSAGQKIAFYCWPGSDPTDIVLKFEGQDSLRVDLSGEIRVWLSGRWIQLREAAAYQVDESNQTMNLNWSATYQHVEGEDLVHLSFDSYDPELPLVLQIGPMPLGADPSIEGLCWSTYYGGSGEDQILASTLDPDGNFYVTGYAGSDFLTFQDAVGTEYISIDNAIPVVKFRPNYELAWMTYYGGLTGNQFGLAIMTKLHSGQHHAYVAGYTTANDLVTLPYTGAYYDGSAAGGNSKGFFARFNEFGIIQWGTYFGDGEERIEGIDFDSQGRMHFVGFCDSSYPSQNLSGANSWPYAGGDSDMMIGRLNANDDLEWCTARGGSDLDYGADIACYPGGFYVSGSTYSTDFPVAGGGATHFGGLDAVLMRFNSGAALQWGRHYGGSGDDQPGYNSLAVDPNGLVLLGGHSYSTDLGTLQSGGGFHQSVNSGVKAGFLARFAAGSPSYTWSTYVGASDLTAIESVSFAKDKIFIGGHTQGADFGTQPLGSLYHTSTMVTSAPQINNWGHDGIVMGFEPSTALAYSTFFGGDNGLWGEGVVTTAYNEHQLYLGGVTSKHIDPTTFFPLYDAGGPPAYYDDAYDPAFTNRLDGFVTVICTDEFTPVTELYRPDAGTFSMAPDASGGWVISGLQEGRYDLTIFDAAGKLVQQQERMLFIAGPNKTAIHSLSAGLYTCVLNDGETRYSARFIIHP